MKLSRIVLLLAVLCVGAGAAWSAYPPFRLFTLYAAGHNVVCPLKNAVDAAAHVEKLRDAKDRILAGSKLVEKDPAGYRLYDTPKGRWWIPEGAEFVLPFNLAEQELDIYGTGEHAVRPGDIVLDCGANVGVFARKALDAGAAKVIVIEPAPENLECLRRNFPSEIAAGTVLIYPKGVWNKDDVLEMNIDPKNSAGDSFVIHREGSHTLRLPLTTIDKMVSELGLSRVDYVKMEIEGAEPKALAGGWGTISRWKPSLSISAYHVPDHPVTIPNLIRSIRGDYRMECGPCEEHDGQIHPDILYFK